MATIDMLDLRVYIQYAKRTELIESINREFRISEAGSIPAQTKVVNMYPKISDIDLLLGFARCHAPWAFFWPPKKFFRQRRPSFTNYRVVPSLGTLEKHVIDQDKVSKCPCSLPHELAEQSALMDCFGMMDKINGWLGHIVGRIAQFLQG